MMEMILGRLVQYDNHWCLQFSKIKFETSPTPTTTI